MVLRVKLEIVPFGIEDRAHEIGRLDIFNTGEGPSPMNIHTYGVIDLSPRQEGLYAERLGHFRHHGAWELVYLALDKLKIDGPA